VKIEAGIPFESLGSPRLWARRRPSGQTFCHPISQVHDFSKLGAVPAAGNRSPVEAPPSVDQECRALVAAMGATVD